MAASPRASGAFAKPADDPWRVSLM